MATTRGRHHTGRTPPEVRWGEFGPSLVALLTASTGLAIVILAAIWFVFFHV